MVYQRPLIEGVLVKRYKRFLADIKINKTENVVTAHTSNTGAMLGCSQPGSKTWMLNTLNSNRKYPYSWELVQTHNGVFVGINTLLANKLVLEGIENQAIIELQGYKTIKKEIPYGNENSRIDFLLHTENQPDCFLEVKSVTLVENSIAFFPDAKSQRGLKHLRELIENVKNGNRSVIFFCIQRNDAQSFSPARHIHPEYADALQIAAKSGVEVLSYICDVSQSSIEITKSIPVTL